MDLWGRFAAGMSRRAWNGEGKDGKSKRNEGRQREGFAPRVATVISGIWKGFMQATKLIRLHRNHQICCSVGRKPVLMFVHTGCVSLRCGTARCRTVKRNATQRIRCEPTFSVDCRIRLGCLT